MAAKPSYFIRTIRYFFKDQLLFTNTITSGAFLAFGDIVNQEIELAHNGKLNNSPDMETKYDWARIGRMFTVGTVMGPLHHYYYVKLDKILPRANLPTAFLKIFLDQTICCPLTLLYFFYSMGYLEGKSLKECNDEVSRKFIYVYLGDCSFWPPIQFVNFLFVRPEYRVFYINFATVFFNVFLSYMKHDF